MSEDQFSSAALALLLVLREINLEGSAMLTTWRRLTTSFCMAARATSEALQSSLSVASTSALALINFSSARMLPFLAAWCSAVHPPGSLTLILAPCSTSASSTSARSAWVAKWMGASPEMDLTAGSALARSRAMVTSLKARRAAMRRGAVPTSDMFGAALMFRRSITSSLSPHFTASCSRWCNGSSSSGASCTRKANISSRLPSRASCTASSPSRVLSVGLAFASTRVLATSE
mmetsp:Transcript_120796/g.276931  ORF Transcript_120796/g.276931 Transcript_120796/m.276931 type:complete len:233 (-) Transcript_120796:376-1074(-)